MTYEFVFLLNEEEELKKIKEFVSSVSGELLKESSFGKKQLAYKIKKNSEAFMYGWELEMEPAKLKEFKKKLSFNEKILRYLLLKTES